MKEQVIETAGKTWQFLAKNGETSVGDLARLMRERDEVVLQAVGWLAREDKINYAVKNKREFISLAENELNIFRSAIQNIENGAAQAEAKSKFRSRTASRI